MRDIFVSERRCIVNLGKARWSALIESRPIVREYCRQPESDHSGQVFNSDFSIEFFDRFTSWPDAVATAGSILPNALGGEIFLIVEKGTMNPMVLELVGGDAFSPRHYSQFADQVNAAVRAAAVTTNEKYTAPFWHSAFDSFSVLESRFVRMLVVGEDITFLSFPADAMPVVRGQRVNLAKADDREIDIYIDGKDIVCCDGWIRAQAVTSDLMLFSMPRMNHNSLHE